MHIYNYLCTQCLSPLTLWVRISIRERCTTLCDKICQWLGTCQWFSPRLPVSSTNKTDSHDITGILLKVALKHHQTNKSFLKQDTFLMVCFIFYLSNLNFWKFFILCPTIYGNLYLWKTILFLSMRLCKIFICRVTDFRLIGWSFRQLILFFFVDQKHTKETRGSKVSKRMLSV